MDYSNLNRVKHIILVLSGKGGVGKTAISSQLALSLATAANNETRVGVLDIDLCGPSVPRVLGVDASAVMQSSSGWVPVVVPNTNSRLKVMSIGFLLPNKDDAVVWRGPKKTTMIQQFLTKVCWGELDYLIIDTPPGTSDEHLAVIEALKDFANKAAVIVTTPQLVAVSDVKKEIHFCLKVELPVLGIVENMSGFRCPHCADCTPIFSSGGGQALADQFGVPLVGTIPIDPAFAQLVDSPQPDAPLAAVYPNTEMGRAFAVVADKVVDRLDTVLAAAAAPRNGVQAATVANESRA
ncbi:hypothetical protein AMAG_16309 [Allomyces macrogynus ATCC 38327]|uniref:Uncharacterized protein n=1 Tax=Allomyces macrogynus (strain ATCC 38327) TaxID=578462 RepID=A0A0L0TAY7_ALLM3|nr:hypothetical protein AMAG_16309 [Allomyces macrogynus ATCC 38327]|eukprot:KNE71880.1 hypothetical protein AMAG_16309 [Allomyces macrogynus ATCC 38327]